MASIALAAAALTLTSLPAAAHADTAQDAFFKNLSALCGQRFEGKVVTTDAADSDFASQRLLMHVRDCSAEEIRIPFWVGADRSRTWVIGRTTTGLRLKHYHRHSDGVEDVRSQYGGDTINLGSAFRQAFPADAFSRALFVREGIPESSANIWSIEIAPGRTFGYELRRSGRFFRVEFDLGRTVPSPGPAWGPR